MPRKPLSEVEKNRVRRKACDAAMKIVNDQGSAALTIRSVAREIGMSAMSLYTYFENKSDLLAHLQADALSVLADRQEHVADAADADETALRALAQDFQLFAVENAEDFRMAFRYGGNGESTRDIAQTQLHRAISPLLRVVESLVKARRLHGDPDEATRAIWASWYGYAALSMNGVFPAEARFDMAEHALNGDMDTASAARRRRGQDWMAAPAE